MVSNTTTILNYYTVNTKAKPNQNRRALRIRLEAFVMFYHKRLIYLAMNCFVECILRSESRSKSLGRQMRQIFSAQFPFPAQ
ncbi:hypothetical protein DDN72_18160 [Vibrio cholerae]|nr:hypothetical protein [Vibrio cholerae]MVB37042.1 hypothetical protein [Vibrio cholerae]